MMNLFNNSINRNNEEPGNSLQQNNYSNKQSFNEGRIQELEAVISRAQIIDPSKMSGDIVRFGATVLLANTDTDEESQYQIVGDYEADIEKHKISLSSPLAKALIGKEIGDVAEYLAPNGKKSYEIIEVKWL